MLINEPKVFVPDPIFDMIAKLNDNPVMAVQLREGVYEIGHFGGSHFLREYEQYPDLPNVGPYGVCDSYEQLLAKEPLLLESERKFVVTVSAIRRADQPDWGGWRWHKWGEYIGTQDPQHEYLYHEPHIDLVYCYHIYEKKA